MALIHFESYKSMVWTAAGLDGGADQDIAPYWGSPTYAINSYTNGPQEGSRAMIVNETIARNFPSGNPSRMVLGGWFRLATHSGFTNPDIMSIAGSFVGGHVSVIRLRLRSDMDLNLQRVTEDSTTTLATISVPMSTSTFHHLELDVDSANDRVRVRKNGLIVADINIALTNFTTANHELRIGHTPPGLEVLNHRIVVSSLYTATDALPTNQSILGTSVSASYDRYEGTSRLYSKMIIDGVEYNGTPTASGVQTEVSWPGKNLSNNIHFFDWVDPSTGLPWTEAGINKIAQWGVCCDPDASKNRLRMTALSFDVMRYNNGMPIVTTIPCGPTAYFVGPWEKSDPSLAYYAHVNKLPRDDADDIVDAKYLMIGDEGCMLFTFGNPDPVDPPLETIGITFAEEFRTDYLDWKRVDGVGQDFDSYFVSGYSLFGQGDKRFNDNYITINYENVGGGNAFAQAIWDFAESSSTSRWSQPQIVYSPSRTTSGAFKHGMRRLLMRGTGRSLQIRIASETGKPFRINGWTLYITSTGLV